MRTRLFQRVIIDSITSPRPCVVDVSNTWLDVSESKRDRIVWLWWNCGSALFVSRDYLRENPGLEERLSESSEIIYPDMVERDALSGGALNCTPHIIVAIQMSLFSISV